MSLEVAWQEKLCRKVAAAPKERLFEFRVSATCTLLCSSR